MCRAWSFCSLDINNLMKAFNLHSFGVATLLSTMILSTSCFAAISISGTRVIYTEKSKETPVTVKNTDDGSIYLIRSWIAADDKMGSGKNVPFIITPPLFRIDSGQDNVIRITKTNDSALPKDRESLFWLNVMAVPPEASGKGSKLQFSLNTRVKLIYRPESINKKAEINEAYQKLQFASATFGVSVKNPTPYYINIASMKFDGVQVKNKSIIVPPMGVVNVQGNAHKNVSWAAINDFGGITKEIVKPL